MRTFPENCAAEDTAGSLKQKLCRVTLWLFNVAIENCPFIDDFPIKTTIYRGFSMAMLNNQMVFGQWFVKGERYDDMLTSDTGWWFWKILYLFFHVLGIALPTD